MINVRIDTRTTSLWAQSLLAKLRVAIDFGLGTCEDGSLYTLHDFLSDTHCGDFPFSEEKYAEVETAMRAHPQHSHVMKDFRDAFGVDFWEQR